MRDLEEDIINITGLDKFYGDKHVVTDVNRRVRQGEILGFLGRNGNGKTTTLRMICVVIKLSATA